MKILSPISWAAANVAVLVGAAVGGLVFVILTSLHLQLVLGINFGIAYAAARWAEVAYHAMTGTPTSPTARRV